MWVRRDVGYNVSEWVQQPIFCAVLSLRLHSNTNIPQHLNFTTAASKQIMFERSAGRPSVGLFDAAGFYISLQWCHNTLRNDIPYTDYGNSLHWRHKRRDGVSNYQARHCLLNRLFGRRSKKTSKLRVTGLCAGNSPGTGEFPAQMTSNAEDVFIWWRHHERYETHKNIGTRGPPASLPQKTILVWRLQYAGYNCVLSERRLGLMVGDTPHD